MADQNEIIAAATRLGNMIAASPTFTSYRELTRQLELDVGAKALLQQFEQLMEALAIKEQNMQPIEVSEKQQLQSIQQSIQLNPLLMKISKSSQEFRELMGKIDQSIQAGMAGQQAPAAGTDAQPEAPKSKIILE